MKRFKCRLCGAVSCMYKNAVAVRCPDCKVFMEEEVSE